MKIFQICLVFLFLSVFSLISRAQSSGWIPFSSPPDGFAVEFPGTPKLTEEKGEFMIRRFTVVDQGRGGYFVQSADAGEEIPAKYVAGIMDSTRDGLAQGLRGKVSEEKPIQCGAYPGRSFVISGPEGWSSVRLCAAGRRMYTVHAGSKSGPVASVDLARFQNSFKLISATP